MKISNGLIPILFLGAFISYGILYVYPKNKKECIVRKETTYQMKLDGHITSAKNNRGWTVLEITNLSGKVYLDGAYNYHLYPEYIGDYIKPGMWIYKNIYSDSVFVGPQKSNRKNLFILGKDNLNKY
ncbi:hypothetical protein INQ51_08805 [Maribellus sp. CM-23]|uniref:hypothetical protein n=1 Tax=Maribellus sp. CM-23 TaxID=2781026 RepID=UPI001F31CC78|nr:hypothetical protein [Maribellus sp. CM-23]MCE4564407.1 hypothetical protein [Maribellus sp. CM-23]